MQHRLASGLSIGVVLLMFVVGCSSSPAAQTAPPTSAPSKPTTAPAAAAASPSPSVAAAVSASPSLSVSPSASPAAAASPSAGAGPTIQTTDALKFDPATVTVARGATVTWRNTSQVPHTVTDDPSKAANAADAALPQGAQPWDSGNLAPGQTFTHTFDVPGTYKYFCQPHEAAGMVATIVVTP